MAAPIARDLLLAAEKLGIFKPAAANPTLTSSTQIAQ